MVKAYVAVLAITCLTSVSGLTCYYCDSVPTDYDHQSSCDDTKKLSTQVCGYNSSAMSLLHGKTAQTESLYAAVTGEKASDNIPWVCAKIVTRYKTDSNPNFGTIRECMPETIRGQEGCKATDLTLTTHGFDVKSCNVCHHNFCNDAAGLLLSNLLIFACLMMITLPFSLKFFV